MVRCVVWGNCGSVFGGGGGDVGGGGIGGIGGNGCGDGGDGGDGDGSVDELVNCVMVRFHGVDVVVRLVATIAVVLSLKKATYKVMLMPSCKAAFQI